MYDNNGNNNHVYMRILKKNSNNVDNNSLVESIQAMHIFFFN